MIMRAKADDSSSCVESLFPPGEGRRKTLGINLPASIAKVIQRTGNRKNSISRQLLSLIDAEKLQAMIEEDRDLQARCDAAN